VVQMTAVAKLREAWAAKGNPPCDHPRVDKEYYLGSQTGDKVCLVCGGFPDEPTEQRDAN
jgi:hypothetical protein